MNAVERNESAVKLAWTELPREAAEEISGSLVIVDDYHLRKIGLSMIGQDCTVGRSLEAAKSHSGDITVIDSRIEMLLEAFELMAEPSGIERLQLVFPPFALQDVLAQLPSSASLATAGLQHLHLAEHYAILRIVPGADTDQRVDGFLAGYQQALDVTEGVAWRDPRPDSEVESLRDELLAVLEALELNELPQEVPVVEEPVSQPVVSEPSAEAAELEKKLVALRAEHDQLQQRYRALSESALGRITLQHWSRQAAKRSK